MKCLIIDDEPLARVLLEDYISRVDGLTLVRSFPNAVEAFSFLQVPGQVDLIFLDIQMPQITGIEFLKSLKQCPRVIFTTAYRNYALDAYDLDVVDYLLKPISFNRFLRSISKVYQLQQSFSTPENNEEPIQNFEQAYIYLKDKRTMVKVFLHDILYVESLRDYVRVKTSEGQIVTYQKIGYMEQKLPEHKFIRVHRSFIVSLDKITSYQLNHVRIGSLEIPIGRMYKNEVVKVLNCHNMLSSV